MCVSCTWKPPISAAPGAAGPPSWLSPPQTRVSSPPAPCAEPPGSSSSAHDAAEAAETQEGRDRQYFLFYVSAVYNTHEPEWKETSPQTDSTQTESKSLVCSNIYIFLVSVNKKKRGKCSTDTKQGRMLGQKKGLKSILNSWEGKINVSFHGFKL